MDKNLEHLIDRTATTYRNYRGGQDITTEGLYASTVVMPVVVRALGELGTDFRFAYIACADWDRQANTYLQNRVPGTVPPKPLDIDPDSLQLLGTAYKRYSVDPKDSQLAEGETPSVVRDITPILIRTLSQMDPAMRLMSKTLSEMAMTVASLSHDDPELESAPIGL